MATSILAMFPGPRDISGIILDVQPRTAIIVVLSLYTFLRAFTVLKMLQASSFFPRSYTAFQPFALPGLLLPTTSWTTGLYWHWIRRFETYKQSETINLIPIVSGIPGLWTSNVDIARQVAVGAHKVKFNKPEGTNDVFLQWGMNLAAADGQMWRKHRRIVGSAFTTELYKLVWMQSAKTYNDMILTEGWDTRDAVHVPVMQDVTMKFAFLIISTCGFGFPATWADPPKSQDGKMPVQQALKIVAGTHLLTLAVPRWLLYLPIPSFTRAREARRRLLAFMHEQVAERKVDVSAGGPSVDAFTTLVKANQDESTKYQLDDEELIGNVFLFMFAGHETTAHSLAATFGFLAVNEEIQEEIVQHILEVVGTDREPQFEDYAKLDKVLAVFYEAARMFPAGHALIREASEDTILTVPNPVGEEGSQTVPIPKGTQIMVDMIGIQYNPRYFEDPQIFKPSRWYGLPADSELFTAFSVGQRACIGRRFATVEATCFLSLFLRDWKVLPILRDGESKAAWKKRVLDAHIVITLGVRDIPLRFERRKRT